MEWLVYENSDDSTQIFIGTLLILSIIFIIGANIYFWISKKIKNKTEI